MALTRNREVDHYIDQELRSFQVAAGEYIHKGAFVGRTVDGYARALIAGDLFVGIAYEEIDNSNGSDGGGSVRVYTIGDFGLALEGALLDNIGSAVFADSDKELTLTSTIASYVGVVVGYICPDQILLRLDTFRRR